MKGTLPLDPAQCDWGPATDAIRQMLLDWAAIDWFAPGSSNRDEASQLFLHHNKLARAFAPALFASYIEVECRNGQWAEFAAWCERARIRQRAWDWKYSALKPLSAAHGEACRWTIEQELARDGAEARSGGLYLRIPGMERPVVVWRGAMPAIAELAARRGEPNAEAAMFYLSYAHDDLIHGIQWQLAERSSQTTFNPFVPLLGCYRAGYYPFVMNRDSALLFRFLSPTMPGPRSA